MLTLSLIAVSAIRAYWFHTMLLPFILFICACPSATGVSPPVGLWVNCDAIVSLHVRFRVFPAVSSGYIPFLSALPAVIPARQSCISFSLG